MFKKSGCKLAPCAKVQFYSDSHMINLVQEINAGNEVKTELEPSLLNYGTIWVSFDAGTNALLPKDEQVDMKSSLECAVVQIPKEWSIVCWLTESLTSILIKDARETAPNFVIEVFGQLI